MILFVDQTGALGGAELSLLDLSSEFRAESRVLLFKDGPFRERLEEAGVEVSVCDSSMDSVRRSAGIFSAGVALGALVNPVREVLRLSEASGVVYPNTQKAAFVSFLAAALSGRSTVWHLRDIITSPHFSSFNRRLIVYMANSYCVHVIANSQATLDAFREAGGRCNASVVYNGLKEEKFEAGREESSVWRARLGLPDATTVGIFGRLAEWKGQLQFVEALAECDGLRGLIVGEALFDGDDAYAEQVKNRVSELGVEDRVSFLGFRDDVPQVMAACDAIVHASTDPEPFGRVIVEAMLSRRPIVATRGGGATELVGEHNERGILVDGGDVAQLRDAMKMVSERSETRDRIVADGLEFARGNCSLEETVRKVRDILEVYGDITEIENEILASS
mgnify:CR=1 FL=1